MPNYLDAETRASILSRAVIGIKSNELSDYINTLKEELNVKKVIVQNIEDAKKDFSGFLEKTEESMDEIIQHMGGDNAKDALEYTSDFLKNATEVREKTLAILGLMKNAKKEFWLALVQLLVDAAKESLTRQQNSIYGMIDTLDAADLPSDLKNADIDPDSLIYAYDRVVSSKKSLEEAREKIGSGGIVVQKLTDRAIILLRSAEQKLISELSGIRKLSEINSAMSGIELLEADLAVEAANYIVHYITTLLTVQAIYVVEEKVMKGKRVLDVEVADKILQDIITSIDDKTKKPMEEMQKKWKINSPSQLDLIRSTTKYSKNIRLHWEKIATFFGENYTNLAQLDIKSADYAKLLTNMQNDEYLNVNRDVAGQDVKELAIRAGIPASNIFSKSKGTQNSVFKTLRIKYTKDLNSVLTNVNRGRVTLGNYGYYKSELLVFIDEGLVALGYGDSPMLDFAMGNLIKTSDIVYGVPSVKEIFSGGSLNSIGIEVSGSYKDKVESEILTLATNNNAINIIIQNRKDARSIEEIMDKTIDQVNSEQAELEEEISILEAGLNGEVPKEYIADKRIII